MQKRFFYRRFLRYFLALFVPTLLVFALSLSISYRRVTAEKDAEAALLLGRVNANLEQAVNNLTIEKVRFVDSANMSFALKNILRDKNSYRDSLNLRVLNAMTRSTGETYPYIDSVFFYIDGGENYFSSVEGRTLPLGGEEDSFWWEDYRSMPENCQTSMTRHEFREGGRKKTILTVCRRLLVRNGVVVMNIDAEKYTELLEAGIDRGANTVVYRGEDGTPVFVWGEALNMEGISAGEEKKAAYWERIEDGIYRLHRSYNSSYRLELLSFMPREELYRSMQEILLSFLLVFAVNLLVTLFLAYYTTDKNFRNLNNIVEIFRDAEKGIYRARGEETKDEYDVIMNNIIYLFLQTVRLDGELKQKQYEKELSQLTALQAQINPHFLFNTLQTIEFELRRFAPGAALSGKMIGNLTDILKYSLQDPMEPVSLRDEISYLKKYVAIQKVRFGEQVIPYYEIEEELYELSVFRLLLQPLVENSILHGIRHKGRGYLRVQVFSRENRVIFRVTDNGIGMDREEKAQLRESILSFNIRHIGLANVNHRLRLYFGEESMLRFRSKKNWGTVMEFSLPKEGLSTKKVDKT